MVNGDGVDDIVHLGDPSYFYRTHVHMGSDHWVAMSVTHSQTFVALEALVKDPCKQ